MSANKGGKEEERTICIRLIELERSLRTWPRGKSQISDHERFMKLLLRQRSGRLINSRDNGADRMLLVAVVALRLWRREQLRFPLQLFWWAPPASSAAREAPANTMLPTQSPSRSLPMQSPNGFYLAALIITIIM